MVMILNLSIVVFAASCTFSWKGYNINGTLAKTGTYSAQATTKITNISAPNAYKVRALVNAKKSSDGTGSILTQDYSDAYNSAVAGVYNKSAKSFVSFHNIQSNGSVVRSNSLTIKK